MKTRAWIKSYVPTVILSLLFLFIAACGSGGGGGGEPAVESVADQTLWYIDNDEDGFGSSSDSGSSEEPAESEALYVTNNLDCNDDNPEINPQALEIQDDVDNNCNEEKNEPIANGYIPDTGQTKSYTDIFGEDSDILISPQSYTKLTEANEQLPYDSDAWAMVRDNVTGLVWEVKQNNNDDQENFDDPHDGNNTYSWPEASELIAKMNENKFGGYNDWRLPTITELLFLSNYSDEVMPHINTQYFRHSGWNKVWSSTENMQQNNSVWAFEPMRGWSSSYDTSQAAVTWAVRGESKASSFVDKGFGVIEDTTNGLMWQQETARADDGFGFNWEQAVEYCNNLELSGYTDWRLPNKHELISLIDHLKKDPAIMSDLFPDTEPSTYWTSTAYEYPNSMSINFKYGTVGYSAMYMRPWVRAVRGGNNKLMKTWYLDSDNDGYGDSTIYKEADSTREPKGYVMNGEDCRDNDYTIHPGAVDIPDDDIDQNCNGKFMVTWYRDGDGDGYGTPDDTLIAEGQPTGYIRNAGDCDDAHIAINPGEDDLPDDGIDNNCNGMQRRSLYTDVDLDGFGDKDGDVVGPPVEIVSPEAGYSVNNLDCKDNDATSNPSQVEIYGDSKDNNCDGEEDELPSQVIPDTGQTLQYTAILGEDSYFTTNPSSPSFTKLDGADVVQDNMTGLIWEMKTDENATQTVTFENAQTYCNDLNQRALAGFSSGWRLPTAKELAFISNADQFSPAIDKGVFPNTLPYRYWTSTPVSSAEPDKYLTIDFKNGTSKREDNVQCHVRAVHDGTIDLESPFEAPDNENQTVREKATGLIWQVASQASGTQASALELCESLGLGGWNDWRLPSEADLKGIQTYSVDELKNVFESPTAFHWTSAMSPTNANTGITVSFGNGSTLSRTTSLTAPFRAVRGQATSRFIDNSNGTVSDLHTGLMWQKAAAGVTAGFTWTDALIHCNQMDLAGHTDWRLPSRNELISLMDDSPEDLQSAEDVLAGLDGGHWTSTASCDTSTPMSAWEINFSELQEKIAIRDRTNTLRIRAVRGGNIIQSP